MRISKAAMRRWLRSRSATVLGTAGFSPLLIANVLHLLIHQNWLPAALSFTVFVVLLVRLRASWDEMTKLFLWTGIALFFLGMMSALLGPSGDEDITYDGSVLADLIFCLPLGPVVALVGMATREVQEKRKSRNPDTLC